MPLVMPEVYSFYFPETASAARAVLHDPERDAWFNQAWLGHQNALPGRFLDTWRSWSGADLSTFPHGTVSNGSSEAIRELIAGTELVIFEGEYEGYAAIATARGMPIRRLSRADPAAGLAGVSEGAVCFISDPASVDGEHWEGLGAFLDLLQTQAPSVSVVLDLAYVGAVRNPVAVRLDSPNVSAVVFSLSKPFSLYRYRVGGVYSRRPLPALAYNHWFNSLLGLKLGIELMERHAVAEVPQRYAAIQGRVVAAAVAEGEVPADTVPSNVILLARSQLAHANPRYNRLPGASRYCLTPGLHAHIYGDSPAGAAP